MNPTATATSGPLILIVDDQEANIQTVGTLLRDHGYEIMPALNAEQALSRLSARQPDLILLDLMMPGISGLDLCRKIQSTPQWYEIPIIFLSAADEVHLVTAALESGAVDYVTKPFRRAELLSRIRTHLTLKAHVDDLRRLATDKEELLSLMAHDVQSRLMAIQLHADFLHTQSATTNSEIKKCASTISRETTSLSATLRQLLTNQRIAQQPVILTAVNLSQTAEKAVATQLALAALKGQHIQITGSTSGPIRADATLLQHIIENILSNSIKFSPPGSFIQVTLVDKNGHASLQVADAGPGFTAEDRERLFTRYGRLSARPTGGEYSTGLGLSIVHTLTQRLGGRIELISLPGESAVFELTFPLIPVYENMPYGTPFA